jgi:hypothetical protein
MPQLGYCAVRAMRRAEQAVVLIEQYGRILVIGVGICKSIQISDAVSYEQIRIVAEFLEWRLEMKDNPALRSEIDIGMK